jgi:phosphopantothenoylcysteine decarboxylase/phosphopantothenate--cysteine ligase
LASGAEVCFIEAQTVEQLKKDIAKDFETADVLIMAAAVSDYRPKKISGQKIKSKAETLNIVLEKTEDLLAYPGNIWSVFVWKQKI